MLFGHFYKAENNVIEGDMAKAKTKRNKKYVPKTAPSKQELDFIYKKHGRAGIEKMMGRYRSPVERELSMTWNVLEAQRLADLHALTNGIGEGEKFSTNMLQNIYNGDLIVAISEEQIFQEQVFNAKIISIVSNDHTGENLVHEYETNFQDPIAFSDFLEGSKTVHIDRGNGVKTRWKGIADEWNDDLCDHYQGDQYELIDASASMWCKAAYITQFQEREAKIIRLTHKMRKLPLGVGK